MLGIEDEVGMSMRYCFANGTIGLIIEDSLVKYS